jgi:DNA polymerase III delta subunit
VVGGEAKKTLAETEALATKTQVFDKLTGDKLLRWIKKESTTRGYALSVAQMAYLAAIGGDDLWAVHNAMEKMAVEPPETRTDNRRTAADATVFQLGDVLFGHPKTALGLLSALLAQGEDEMRIFSYLVGAGRTALVVRSALDAERPVSPAHRIHPFVLKKTATAVRGLTMRETVRRLALFWDADVKIKTGLSGPVDALYRIIVSAMISR